MRVLVFLPVLLAALGAGYWLGVRDRRAALAAAYAQTVPLLRSVRQLVAADPASPSYTAVRAVAENELDQYELGMRAL
jgi:hypothetical protein